MKSFRGILILLFSAILLVGNSFAQGYVFKDEIKLNASPVKNQASTGTCWDFATTSFFESELIRMGKGLYDLSEMYIDRYAYIERIKDNYYRGGKGNLGQGGVSHIYTTLVEKYGLMPEEVYTGINYKSETHNHSELNKFANALASASVELKKKSPEFDKLVNSLLDIYLGPLPEKFTYKGKEYTAMSFYKDLGINLSDYVEITSFSHVPFYEQFILEIPDNWNYAKYYNVPLDELMAIMDNSLNKGYTICWDGDVSEKSFSHLNGVAINPDLKNTRDISQDDRSRFEKLSNDDKLKEVLKFEKPFPEIVVSQEIRQDGYESFKTTDDHLMHITGITRDQNGTKYYITKNSWGTERNKFGGYLNMSESYVRAKTIAIMIHKNAIPTEIKNKLGIK